MRAFYLLIALVATIQVAYGSDSISEKLFRSKVKDYQKAVDPGNFTLDIGMTYLCGTVNPRTRVLTSRVYERYSWVDPRITWNPKDFAGLAKGSIDADILWKPDVQLLNAFPNTEDRTHVNTIVLSNGTIYWIPPATYHTLCHHDEEHHSYHCKLRLGSWTYNALEMPVHLFAGGFDTNLYLQNCPYVVTHHTAYIHENKYDCCPQPYLTLDVDLELKERDHEDEEEEEEEKKKPSIYEHRPRRQCYWPHC